MSVNIKERVGPQKDSECVRTIFSPLLHIRSFLKNQDEEQQSLEQSWRGIGSSFDEATNTFLLQHEEELKNIAINNERKTGTTTTVYTVGYQGLDIDEFVKKLKNNNIETVIDVRANPVSETPEFSRYVFEDRLFSDGMSYVHFPCLGIPVSYKDLLTDLNKLFYVYSESLLPSRAREIDQIFAICCASNSVLFCMESDPVECHRHVLANRLARMYGVNVKHL